jgi:uncharacterized tellurite resistance protein B-like protein
MHILALVIAVSVIVAIILYNRQGKPAAPYIPGGWGASTDNDPRVAVAAMLVAIAIEDGPLTTEEQSHIERLLVTRMRLTQDIARTCVQSGIRAAQRQSGSLNSRLHQFRPVLSRHCSEQELQDVVEMLREIAGSSGERVWSIRDALGRISASLLANDR